MIREWFERKLPLMTYHGKPMEQVMSRQMVEDLYHFEGNAQAFRLVTKLHFLVDERGMNLTYALLSTIVKYPVPSQESTWIPGILRRARWDIIWQMRKCSVRSRGRLERMAVGIR